MIFGRIREIDGLEQLLSEAAAGRGGLRVVSGEPGIGKTRLADEFTARAVARGFAVAWGRAWETGGAPAYWPWLEILDRLATPEMELSPRVAAFLDRSGTPARGEQTRADPAHELFDLFEAVRIFLRERSRDEPVLLVFDDLHVADLASLELLSFVARGLRASRIAVVGTYRDAEARLPPVADVLPRIAREGETIALSRLCSEEVAEMVRHELGRDDAALAATVFELTEGNPLFVREALHAVTAGPYADTLEGLREVVTKGGVLALIRRRLAGSPGELRDVLETAAVLGRVVDRSLLTDVTGHPHADVRRQLDEATKRGLLVRRSKDQWAFSHVLVREAFYREMRAARRLAAHAAACAALRRQDSDAPEYLTTLAHHAIAALPNGDRTEAVRIARRAAEHARSHLAYDEAIALLDRALTACEGDVPQQERVEVELALGWACTEAGKFPRGRELFRLAAERARELGDAHLLARAAQGQGGQYILGETRGELVAILREALAAITEEDATDGRNRRLRATLLARLAAALTPSATPEEPLGFADQALAMTQDETERRVRIYVDVGVGSALMDHAPPDARVPVNERLLADARAVGDRVLELRALTRLSCDYLERGDTAAADAAIAARSDLADSIGHARYRWQTPLLRSMRAMPDGRFDDCEAEIAEARELASEALDPNSDCCIELHRFWMLLIAGRTGGLRAQEARALHALDVQLGGVLFRWISAVADAHLGQHEHAANALDALSISRDCTARMSRAALAEAAVLCGAHSFAERIGETFSDDEDCTASWGPFAFVCSPPIALVLGAIAYAVDRPDEGAHHCARAVALSQRMNADAHLAWGHLVWGEGLAPTSRAREHLERALDLALRLQMPEVARRATAAHERCPSEAPKEPKEPAPQASTNVAAPRFSMQRDGSQWTIEHAGNTFQLESVRGLGMLDMLVSNPYREIHVLDLDSGGSPPAPVDVGDAGEVIDRDAREAYKSRIMELRSEIEKAERDADLGRLPRLRYELEWLMGELAAAVGLGGRERRVGSAVERARVNVQRRIRAAIEKITDEDPALGTHLDWTVRTGRFCAYEPRGRNQTR